MAVNHQVYRDAQALLLELALLRLLLRPSAHRFLGHR